MKWMAGASRRPYPPRCPVKSPNNRICDDDDDAQQHPACVVVAMVLFVAKVVLLVSVVMMCVATRAHPAIFPQELLQH